MILEPGVTDLRRWPAAASALRAGEPSADPARFTLVFLHHAGGSSGAFTPFVPFFPADWNMLSVDLPGRMMTRGQRACRTSGQALDFLLPRLRPLLDGPFAVFGHSMGALIAFEAARELSREAVPPVWVGLSGAAVPGSGPDRAQRHSWSRERLTAFMRRLGGTPDSVFAMPDVLDVMMRVLRDDLAIVDTYRRHPGPPLHVPVSVFTGQNDPVAPPGAAAPWSEQTTARTTTHSWPGGHFYLFDHVEAVSSAILRDIDAARLASR
ncbi:thioesterase II family protein [Streptomyces sp. NPDC049813]|uniref:thioesterase II family protein n=1 Tax=Streptomyces sp. NPDC049813 TaxID=3365597 RepID=UPI0037A3E31A